jgi:hypothetical protein
MKKLSETLKGKVGMYYERPIWTMLPSTIEVLKAQRRKPDATDFTKKIFFRQGQGINATIILMSATCIEGFIVECLKSFTMGYRFSDFKKFEGRLNLDFLKRIDKASFAEFPDLFKLTLGAKLQDLIADKDLVDAIQKLIDFRNGIGHGRSVIYVARDEFVPLKDEPNLEVEEQYQTVHKYLEAKGLVNGTENMFNDAVADYFSSLVKPYMIIVLSLLPSDPQSDNVKHLVEFAFKDSDKIEV